MQRITIAILIFLGISACRIPSSMADEVQLANGDRISGEIVKMEGEIIVLKASYAEKIEVKWEEVVCLSSDKEMTFVLKTNEVVIGTATCPSRGNIKLVGEIIEESSELPISDLKAINPSPPPPAVKYRALVSAGGSVATGNTRTKTFNSSAAFQVRSKRQRLTFEGKFNWGESNNEVDKRNWLGSMKYDFFVTKKIYTYLQTLFEHDAFQDLDLRTTAGAGLGYQFLETERTKLFVELGPSYFNENYKEADDRSYLSGRWSVGFNHDLLPARIKVFHRHEGYYGITESEGVYIRSEQGVRLALVRNFFLNFQVDYSFRSDPQPGIKSSDTLYILGLGYELNF